MLKLGNISLDGTKLHADASKSRAVSCKHAGELVTRLRREVEELMRRAEQADRDGREVPPNLNVAAEIAFRQERLANLAEAKRVREARAPPPRRLPCASRWLTSCRPVSVKPATDCASTPLSTSSACTRSWQAALSPMSVLFIVVE